MISIIIAPLTLVLIIVFIATGKLNRLVASLTGAIIVAFSLIYIDKIDMMIVAGFIFGENDSNLQAILFIFGMMVIIIICKKSGVFIYIAFRLVQFAKGNGSYILYILCFFSFIFSSLSSNIVCIFLIIPLTITICKMLDINPIPYILSEGMVINLGGLLFVISSIPNLLISNSINWTFPQYFMDIGFFSIILFLISIIFLSRYNKEKLKIPKAERIELLLDYDAWMFVKSKKNFYKSLIMFILTITAVIIVPLISTISIDIIALIGGILTILLVLNDKFELLWKELDLELIFYLFCILFISEAITFTGVLTFVSSGLNYITGGDLISTSLLLLWISGILSSIMDNAPITKIFIPIVNNMSTLGNQRILFSAVSVGTILGENLSIMGDNLVLILMVREYGYQLTFSTFMKLGIVITVIQLIASSIFLIMKISNQFFFIGLLLLILILLIVSFYPKILKILKNL